MRQCELRNLASETLRIELVDGLQNILPAGTPLPVQTSSSNLVDAYKWSELDAGTGLAMYALYSGISDRAEPSESLRANVVYGLGLDAPTVLLSSLQLDDFHRGEPMVQEDRKRGIRGAYFLRTSLVLPGGESRRWQIVADIERTQGQVLDVIRHLADPAAAAAAVACSVDAGCDELARIVAAADGFQSTAEESVTAHHYANVLFNVLRGGIFHDQYRLPAADFARHVRHFNAHVYERHQGLLAGLPESLSVEDLRSAVQRSGDPQLERLCHEYLPITFGRRHGDPSRPWNRFAIRLKDARGERLLSYEGNWRDIFQNWEALTFSFPEFIEYVVAKFVNASTVDGYNPYRITREGIDWEVEEPGNPWSHIGYWGDHQIIYLLKFLEHSQRFHPARLRELLHLPVFSYANVPYRIRSFAELVADPKRTVDYDHALAARIADRVAVLGADGKLVLDGRGEVYQVNLLEKLLVPLLAKLGNLVVDGGIWLNTQRPEWNDANNALVGHGVSMVTLYYMRRYVRFLQELLAGETGPVELSAEVGAWLADTCAALADIRASLGTGRIGPDQRWHSMQELGLAASRYRQSVYRDQPFSGKVERPLGQVMELLDDTLAAIDHTIRSNRRADGTYDAYNLLDLKGDEAGVDPLYLMLEGQVAALSSGAIAPQSAAALVETLFETDIYRADQRSFMLYPDRPLPGFLEKNRVPAAGVEEVALLRRMIAAGDDRIVARDADGGYRFNADFRNVGDLDARLDALSAVYGEDVEASRAATARPLRSGVQASRVHRSFRQHVRLRGSRLHLLAHGVEAAARDPGELLRGARKQCSSGGVPAPRRPVLPGARRHRLQQDAGRVWRLPDGPLFAYARARRRPAARDDRAGQGRGADPLWRAGRSGRRRRSTLRARAASYTRVCVRASSVPIPRRPRPMAGADGSGVGARLHLVPGPDRLSFAQRSASNADDHAAGRQHSDSAAAVAAGAIEFGAVPAQRPHSADFARFSQRSPVRSLTERLTLPADEPLVLPTDRTPATAVRRGTSRTAAARTNQWPRPRRRCNPDTSRLPAAPSPRDRSPDASDPALAPETA